MKLYEHKPHPHRPQNVNVLHQAEIAIAGFNQRLAVKLTKSVGNMWTAYLFVCLAVAGFPGLHASLPAYVQWFSQTFLQLVFLPVLSVGQQVLSKHQELMAEEQFQTTQKSYSDIEQIMHHLDVQDQKILEILEKLERRRS